MTSNNSNQGFLDRLDKLIESIQSLEKAYKERNQELPAILRQNSENKCD